MYYIYIYIHVPGLDPMDRYQLITISSFCIRKSNVDLTRSLLAFCKGNQSSCVVELQGGG